MGKSILEDMNIMIMVNCVAVRFKEAKLLAIIELSEHKSVEGGGEDGIYRRAG